MRSPARFSPIAVVGQGVVLPGGVLTPEALWDAVSQGRDLLTESPVPLGGALALAGEGGEFRDRGGFVTGFADAFDPGGYAVSSDEVLTYDIQIQWVMHAGRAALTQAGYAAEELRRTRANLIMGNLGFPTRTLRRLAEQVWLRELPTDKREAWGVDALLAQLGPLPDPRGRFVSGEAMRLAARALGIPGQAWGIDAACASALYAIEIAARQLAIREIDLAVAGGVNGADPLVLHKGFRILRAMSPTGQSRPFDAAADGIVPAEGAVVVVLKRLEDAMRDGNAIFGVIRGIGLSNDGSDGGRLSPSVAGQTAAIRAALAMAGWGPDALSLLECHATGAPRGDATELMTLRQIFRDVADPVPIGSLKSNLGHLVTASGGAGLVKVLLAMAHRMRPPTRNVTRLRPEGEGAPVRVLAQLEPWPSAGVRRAGVSSFGFGGTNGHLLVEEYEPLYHREFLQLQGQTSAKSRLAVVALGAVDPAMTPPASVQVPTIGTRLSPSDLQACSDQQVLGLGATQAVLRGREGEPEGSRVGVYVGTESDPQVVRHLARVDMAVWLSQRGTPVSHDMLDFWAPAMSAAEVMGVLPNMAANLINYVWNFTGPGLTLSSGRASGLAALKVAALALQNHVVDVALVGGVDTGRDRVHTWAMRSLETAVSEPKDGALMVKLERLDDARQQGHPILAEFDVDIGCIEAADEDLDWYTTATLRTWLRRRGLVTNGTSLGDGVSNGGLAHRSPVSGLNPKQPRTPLDAPGLDGVRVMAPPPSRRPAFPLALVSSQAGAGARVAKPAKAQAFEALRHVHERFILSATEAHRQFLNTIYTIHTMPGRPTPSHGASDINQRSETASSATPALVLDRQALTVHASGPLSEVFGPRYQAADSYRWRARMPAPPLLLADRAWGLEGIPGQLGFGRVQTETAVTADSWYMMDGYMAAGPLVEAGQADLLLMSWLGIDFVTQGTRVYRLLGCDLTFHGPLPQAGAHLRFAIEIDRYLSYGPVHLFFFHNDGYVGADHCLSVRNAQAGFFTPEELAEATGVLYDPKAITPKPGVLDPPVVPHAQKPFGAKAMEALAEGRPWACFGSAFHRAQSHVRTPRIPSGPLRMIERVVAFDIRGGPWGRGYLAAETDIRGDEWYFEGHFLHDPAMPGTLMFEGTLQTLAVYLIGMGYTLDCDGWRFQPQQERTFRMVCRGQVTPQSRQLRYEVFVRDIQHRPRPLVVADVLVTVDGVKAFYCEALALELVPDWPITSLAPSLQARYDPQVLEAAVGRLSTVFGDAYRIFDSDKRGPRLPGPPYLFVSRIVAAHRAPEGVGSWVKTAFDIDSKAWYAKDSGGHLGVAVLTEIALQPCGWLASYVGIPLASSDELFIRNLDGEWQWQGPCPSGHGTIMAEATLSAMDRVGSLVIERYSVQLFWDAERVARVTTTFGHFTREALQSQSGISKAIPLEEPDSDAEWPLTLPVEQAPGVPTLSVLDEITGYWPNGGSYGLGAVRGIKRLQPGDWAFRAHFYQDPVQPGSLGLEAVFQLVAWVLERRWGDAVDAASLRLGPTSFRWKYRGQILPEHHTMTAVATIRQVLEDEDVVRIQADAGVWVDGLCIYEIEAMEAAADKRANVRTLPGAVEELWNPADHPWISDHRPTLTGAAWPLAYVADYMASYLHQVVPARIVSRIQALRVHRWIVAETPLRLKLALAWQGTDVVEVTLFGWRESPDTALSRFEALARGIFEMASTYPPASALPRRPLSDAIPIDSLYEDGVLIHGPHFHVITGLWLGAEGARAVLKVPHDDELQGSLGMVLLDGVGQTIGAWFLYSHPGTFLGATPGAAFPVELMSVEFFGPPPADGHVTCEVQLLAAEDETAQSNERRFAAQLWVGDELWACLTCRVRVFPTGRWGQVEPKARRRHLRGDGYVAGTALSEVTPSGVILEEGAVSEVNWFPGTVESVYGLVPDDPWLREQVAAKDWLAAAIGQHPSRLLVRWEKREVLDPHHPLNPYRFTATSSGTRVTVSGPTAVGPVDVDPVRRYIAHHSGQGGWFMEDVWAGLLESLVGKVVLSDPEGWARIRSGPVLYLANHQTGVESMLLSLIAGTLGDRPVAAVAKQEHRTSWIGRWMAWASEYPGVAIPKSLIFVDRALGSAVLDTVRGVSSEIQAGTSLLVHVEGTRALSGRHRTQVISGLWLDLAVELGVPIMPVRMVGGLPVEPISSRLEFPWHYARQDYYWGTVIFPEELRAMGYKARREQVLEALNRLGVPPNEETPNVPNLALEEAVHAWMAYAAVPEPEALIAVLLHHLPHPGRDVEQVLASDEGRVTLPATERGRWLQRVIAALWGRRAPVVEWAGGSDSDG
ncbi:MAG: beta-ketoacyl synthase N-terminal-like domain-containing protein [Firmicutes bacterium]|nr:beta-ketoacyl synthase N-terminal-like domain-containing protein [Bacillota bacterium]